MEKERLLEEIAGRAPYYVPEWRFNPASPDAGAVLASVWCGMFSGTLERFGRLPDNCRRALLDVIGSVPRKPLPARGYLAFQSAAEDGGIICVPAGTGAACPEDPQAVMETDAELIVSPAVIGAIYCAFPQRDILTLYNGRENITLFGLAQPAPHVWTLYHPYAFCVSQNAALRLNIRLDNADVADLCGGGVLWESGDGEEWTQIDARPDGGDILLAQNRGGRALRITLPGGQRESAALRAVTAMPSENALFPDAVYAGDTQQSGDRVYPFDRRFIPGLCFYIACADAFGKPGARIEVSFHLDFEDFPIEGYPDVQIRMKKLMKAEELAPPAEYVIDISETVWEYFNGTGWAVLPAGEPGMFSSGPSRRRAVSFTCPEDMAFAVWGAHELPFIRARILGVNNLFRMRGHYRTPVISGLRIRYAGEFPVPEAEVYEHMESRAVALDGTPVPLRGALDTPGAVYFAFAMPFSQGGILFHLTPGQAFKARWEYAVGGGWAALDVHDGTKNLSQTGILTYQAPLPCAKTRLFGREGYWMRVCDADNTFGRFTQSGPRLLGIFENAVSATARTPGVASNLPSGAFSSLLAPVAGISAVFNPTACAGGVSEEDEQGVIRRLTAGLCHGGRAVSARDCEELALESSPLVLRARLYCRTGEDGAENPDCDCLALLSAHGGRGDFGAIGRAALAFVAPRRPLGAGRLCVAAARFVDVNVTVHAAISAPEEALNVKRRILETLSLYLDAARGGPEGGWQLGTLPSPEDIAAVLRTVPGIASLYGVKAVYKINHAYADYARAVREPFALPADGTHEIAFRVA
ncbi:MAG: baseplate J/gp47 family protein [Oscillospiraceae bacterium]|jgi:hypothetical protein|nr:baseplate J/gp47 family protein [Oscillospiraceae bacterium]